MIILLVVSFIENDVWNVLFPDVFNAKIVKNAINEKGQQFKKLQVTTGQPARRPDRLVSGRAEVSARRPVTGKLFI